MTYDAQGKMTSRTEAFGEPEERTISRQYDPTYPDLITQIERPSTTGVSVREEFHHMDVFAAIPLTL